jgi:hypothetical protein
MVARYEVYGSLQEEPTRGFLMFETNDLDKAFEILKRHRDQHSTVWIYDVKEGITVHKERMGM